MAVASHICIYSLQNLREVERDVPLCRYSPNGLYDHTGTESRISLAHPYLHWFFMPRVPCYLKNSSCSGQNRYQAY